MSELPQPPDFMAGFRKNKYNAKKTVVDGITFASKVEAKRYGELRLLEKGGEILYLEPHPAFELHAALSCRKEPGEGKIGKYIADFKYVNNRTQLWVYEDVKAWDKKAKKGKGDWIITSLSKWKIRHTEAEYGIKITIV